MCFALFQIFEKTFNVHIAPVLLQWWSSCTPNFTGFGQFWFLGGYSLELSKRLFFANIFGFEATISENFRKSNFHNFVFQKLKKILNFISTANPTRCLRSNLTQGNAMLLSKSFAYVYVSSGASISCANSQLIASKIRANFALFFYLTDLPHQ